MKITEISSCVCENCSNSTKNQPNMNRYIVFILFFCFLQAKAEAISFNYDSKRDSLTFIGEGTLEQKHVKQALAKYPRTKIVYVGGNISTVGYEAFKGCNNVETIIFSSSVWGSGYCAIRNCKKLSKVVLPENYKTIACFLVDCPNLESFVIPDSVTGIKELSSDCPFRKLHIGQNLVHTVGDYGIGSNRLSSITVSPGNKRFFSQDGVLFSYAGNTNSDTLRDKGIVGSKLVKYPPCKTGERYEIPSGVMTLDWFAFVACQFDTLVCPASVKIVHRAAICYCEKLRCVEMHWQNPNEVSFDSHLFDVINTSEVTLKVPKGTKNLYIELFNNRMGYQFKVEE